MFFFKFQELSNCNTNGIGFDCFNKLKSNINFKMQHTNCPIFTFSLRKGYNFITDQFPKILKKGIISVFQFNDKIKTFKRNANEIVHDMTCEYIIPYYNCHKTLTNINFAIKLIAKNDNQTYANKTITLKVNYTKCGIYNLNVSSTFYSNLIGPNTISKSTQIIVREKSKSNETCESIQTTESNQMTSLKNSTSVNSFSSSSIDNSDTIESSSHQIQSTAHFQSNPVQTTYTDLSSTLLITDNEKALNTFSFKTVSLVNSLQTKFETTVDSSTSIYQETSDSSFIHSLDFNATTSIALITESSFSRNSILKSFAKFYSNKTFILDLLKNAMYNINGCLRNCSYEGYCQLNAIINHYQCECNANYTGYACEIDIGQCSYLPCMNNGICEAVSTNDYLCICENLFYGNRCQFKFDLCKNKSCSFNGFCMDIGQDSKCQCYLFYSGINCEIQSDYLKFIKAIISTATIIAFIVIAMFICVILFSDGINFSQGKYSLTNSLNINTGKNRKHLIKY
jgi:hypothetical protein